VGYELHGVLVARLLMFGWTSSRRTSRWRHAAALAVASTTASVPEPRAIRRNARTRCGNELSTEENEKRENVGDQPPAKA